MRHEKKKLLWYAGLSFLLLGSFYISYVLDINNPMGLFVVAIIVIILLVQFSYDRGRTISRRQLSNYALVWEDQRKPIRQMIPKKWAQMLFAMSSTVLIYAFVRSLKTFSSTGAGFAQWWAFTVILLVSTLFFAGQFVRGKRQGHVSVYKEGIRHKNSFIKWEDIKEEGWPQSFEVSRRMSPYVSGAASYGHTYRIMDKDEKVHLMEILDKKGFLEALKKINRSS